MRGSMLEAVVLSPPAAWPPAHRPTVLVQVPGSFFSHMGVFAKGDPRLNHWPIGVVSPQALGAASLADLEAQLRRRVAALPGGEARIICTLSRGEAEVRGIP